MTGKVLGFLLKLLPSWSIWIFARRFIAGKTIESAVAKTLEMNARGFSVSLDYIGEDAEWNADIQRAKHEYSRLLEAVSAGRLMADISIKLSHFGIIGRGAKSRECSFEYGCDVVDAIASCARKHDIRVWIDAERLETRKETWRIARALQETHGNIGIRIQAYAKDAAEFLERQIQKGWRGAVGVCKGAYREPAELVITGNGLLENFLRLCQLVLGRGIFLQIDTHDEELCAWIHREIGDAPHEHGLLRGVNTALAVSLKERGEGVRIYTPFGENFKEYTIRRILEKPEYILLPFQRSRG